RHIGRNGDDQVRMAGGTMLQVAEIVRGRVSRDDLNVGARAACAVPGQLVERMRPQPVGVRGQADMSATRTLGSSRFAAGRHTNCQKGNEQSPAYARLLPVNSSCTAYRWQLERSLSPSRQAGRRA